VPGHSTLLAITVFTPALAGCLLLLSWLQHRRVTALALWGSGFITASVATTLIIVLRGTIPNFWSIIVGNALLATAYGVLWNGARKFDGKSVSILLALVGVVFWLVACSIDPIYSRPEARATVMATIGVAYTLLVVFELWRGRGDQVWRWPIMVLLLAHAAAIPIHIPLAGAWTHPDPSDPSDLDLLTFAVFEGAFVCICTAYLFGGLAKDRIAAKRINDRYGHDTGDEVITVFCRLARSLLRSNDLFGRIGGEEFACLLPTTERLDALRLAERVRAAFETAYHTIGEDRLRTTVSAGVAIADNSNFDLDTLLKHADRALSHAKRAGRNCVQQSQVQTNANSGAA
jgi:diguanylate cyclase (GGDEF)-like protein